MKQWSVAKLNKERAGLIADNYDLPPIIATLLDIRGIVTEEEINDFLYNESDIDNPFEIKGMKEAVERIRYAAENGEKICVYGDYDADGVTSTALLFSYLDTIGANVIYYIPSRENEGYGLNFSAIDYLANENVNLIVTVDNGISAIDEIAYANSKGIETVITDHHMPSSTIPNAVAVVDLHQENCNSKFKMLSGVGVAFKLVMALEGEYCDLDMLLDNYSDLVSIGTIGDIVPLVSENRVFVKRGISNISNSDRTGISAIIKEAGLEDKEITSGNISFTLVPRINAVGRLGMSQNSVSLLLTEDDEYAFETASKLGADNLERQKIEKEILENINSLIARNPSIVQQRIIVVAGEGWHQGVIGIVSSRIKDIYGKPCIVISNTGGVCRGSGRSVEGFDLWEAVSSCAEHLIQYGGHPMAVGLSLDYDKIDDFTYALNEFAKKSGEMPYQKLNIDCKLNPAYLDVDIAKQIKMLEPFGAGNPTPVFQLCRLKITNIIPLSNDKHLKLMLSNSNARISALRFFSSSAEFQYKVGDIVDIAVTLEVNEYNNQENLSVIIRDIKFADIDNTDYLKSLSLYERFCNGEQLSKQEVLSLIPSREDFALVYRYLKQNSCINYRIDVMAYRLNNKLSYGKIKVILEAMNELGLIAIYEDMKKFEIKMCSVTNKVNIEDSLIIKRLKEVYQVEQI